VILPHPFCVLILESQTGLERFHDTLATLDRQEGRPAWAGWILDAVRRTRTDVPADETAAWTRTLWFRLEGRDGADLSRDPYPGIQVYLPGDDAPVTTDPLTVRDAQYILPVALARFLRRLGEEDPIPGDQGAGEPSSAAPVATPETEPEPEPEQGSSVGQEAEAVGVVEVPPARWTLISNAQIDALEADQIYSWIQTLEREYHVRPPQNSEFIPIEDLRAWLHETAGSDRVREAWERRQVEVERRSENEFIARFSTTSRGGEVLLNYSAIADHVAEELRCVSYRRTIYIYDTEHGIYRANDGDVEEMTQEVAEQCKFTGKISSAKREIVSHITDMRVTREYPFNQNPGIPCANGVVVIDYETGARTLEPHSPENRYTYRLPVAYNPEADPTEIIQVLSSWADEGNYEVLLQIPAQALLQATVMGKPYKKSYIVHGDTNGGKSSYIELLRRTFGDENTARVMLQRIGQDRFCLASMEGKMFNIYDDLDDVPMQNSTVLKTLTGFDWHDVERKGIDAYRARIFCVHLFTCNRPPETPDRVKNDAAFWERWEYLTFPNLFEVDPSWYDRVLTPQNSSAFLNLVIGTMIRIVQSGSLLVRSSAYEVRDVWQTNADPIYKFITENLNHDGKGVVEKEDAYRGFLNFARTESVNQSKVPTNLEMFAKCVFRYGFAPARVMVKGERRQVFRGYVWKSTSQYKPGGATNATISATRQGCQG
jgi:putative DNA primase/helicase